MNARLWKIFEESIFLVLKIEEGGMDQVLWSLEAAKGDMYTVKW